VRKAADRYVVNVSGPLIASGPEWKIEGIDADTVEIVSPPAWITATQLAHLVRDGGKIIALEVSTGRIKTIRFERAG
jgi:D-aminopeptidase